MSRLPVPVLLAVFAAAALAPAAAARQPTVRLVFGGDAMLGRGVEPAAAARPGSLFAGVRRQVAAADLAIANLESPLTSRPHDPARGPNALEAPPQSARLLRAAGFDALALANNHAGDAGPSTVADSLHALAEARLLAVGAGRAGRAGAPAVVRVRGVRVALLAFDATGIGPPAEAETPGVARWSEARARAAVRRARSEADVVAVGVHGGAEYLTGTDPQTMRIARELVGAGADIVWGTGPHVVQPVHVLDGPGGRSAIVATSLGNLLFDQHVPGTRRGALLEVLAGRDGVRAFRAGAVHAAPPVRFLGWRPPHAAAAALDGEWWSLAGAVRAAPRRALRRVAGFRGDIVAAALGRVTGDGSPDLVVAFRRPFTPTAVNRLLPRRDLVDRRGRSAHVGVYDPRTLRPRWIAGTLARPVAALAACDGAVAVAYSTLDRPAHVGAGAWRWSGFGFLSLPDLPGGGRPACADVDGDGRLDPVILARSAR